MKKGERHECPSSSAPPSSVVAALIKPGHQCPEWRLFLGHQGREIYTEATWESRILFLQSVLYQLPLVALCPACSHLTYPSPTQTRIHREAHTHRHRVTKDTQTHIQTHYVTHSHTDTQRCTQTQKYRHTHAEIDTHTYRNTHIQRHTRTHIQIHAETQTHIQRHTHVHRFHSRQGSHFCLAPCFLLSSNSFPRVATGHGGSRPCESTILTGARNVLHFPQFLVVCSLYLTI